MAGGQRLDAKSLQGTGDSGKGFHPARLISRITMRVVSFALAA
jgi:hypothetical protein